ncbi:MAG: adenine phosphoribosyltransferase [bacterium]|nr:adenine phosphoribosyltransferase [bacterium]
MEANDLRHVIRDVPDFPKPGILFKDITPVLENPAAYAAAIDGLRGLLAAAPCDRLAAIESRGFVFGGPLALQLGLPLSLVRKAGKLPAATRAVTYALEYGTATIEAHLDSFHAGERVVIVDDLLATGGTAPPPRARGAGGRWPAAQLGYICGAAGPHVGGGVHVIPRDSSSWWSRLRPGGLKTSARSSQECRRAQPVFA